MCQWPRSPGFAVLPSHSIWQAEEAVANLPLRLAVRVRCGHQACAQHDGVHVGYSSGTQQRVLLWYSGGTLGYTSGTPAALNKGYSYGTQGYPRVHVGYFSGSRLVLYGSHGVL
jgi:hypothetical protein